MKLVSHGAETGSDISRPSWLPQTSREWVKVHGSIYRSIGPWHYSDNRIDGYSQGGRSALICECEQAAQSLGSPSRYTDGTSISDGRNL